MAAPVIDVGKLKATNSRLLSAFARGIDGAMNAVMTSAIQLARDTGAVTNRTGKMRAGWGFRVTKTRYGAKGTLFNRVPHAAYQEFGTGYFGPNHAPYEIRPKEAQALAFVPSWSQGLVFRKLVIHPGVHPRYIGRAAIIGGSVAGRNFGVTISHARTARLILRWISSELSRVK